MTKTIANNTINQTAFETGFDAGYGYAFGLVLGVYGAVKVAEGVAVITRATAKGCVNVVKKIKKHHDEKRNQKNADCE